MSGFPQKFYHAVFWPIRILMGFAHPIVHVRGLENIPDGPAVICCNHSSFSDAIWVIVCSHQKRIFHTMAKKELFSHRVLGWFITKLGAFPVDREANDIHAVKTALGVLREGDKLLIFPEGTRSKTGHMLPLLGGASLLALKSGCDVVPVYIEGNYKPFHRMKVHVGKPIVMDDLRAGRMNKETCDELTRRMEAEFAQLSGGRSLPPAQ